MPKSSTRVGNGVRFRKPEDTSFNEEEFISKAFSRTSEVSPPNGKTFTDLVTHLERQLRIIDGATRRNNISTSNPELDDTLRVVADELDLVIRVIRLFHKENISLRRKFGGEQDTIRRLHSERLAAIEKYNSLLAQNDSQTEAIERLSQEKNDLSDKCTEFSLDIERYQNTIIGHEQQIRQLIEDNATVRTEFEELRNRNPQLDSRIAELEELLDVSGRAIRDKDSEIQSLKHAIKENEQLYQDEKKTAFDEGYQKGNSEQQRIIDSLTRDCDKYRKEIEKENKKTDMLEERVSSLHANAAKLTASLMDTKSQIKALQRDLDDSNNRNARVATELDRSKSRLVDLQSDHKIVIDELQSKLAKSKSYQEKLLEELETLRKNYDNVVSLRSEAELALKRCNMELTSLKAELHEKDDATVVIRAKLDASERQRESLKVSESSLQQSVNKLQKTISTQTVQLQELDGIDIRRLQDKLKISLEEAAASRQGEENIRQEFMKQAMEWNTLHASLKNDIHDRNIKLQSMNQELEMFRSSESNSDSQIRARYEQLYERRINEFGELCRLEVADREREISELKQNRDMYKEHYRTISAEYGNLQIQYDKLNAELGMAASSQQRIPELLNQISEQAHKVNDLEAQILSANEHLSQRQRELDQAKTNLDSLLSDKLNVEFEKKSFASTIAELQTRLKQITQDIEEKKINDDYNRSLVAQLRDQITNAHRQISSLENEKFSKAAEIEKLNSSYQELLRRIVPMQERQEGLIVKLRFIKALHDYYYPSLDQSIDAAFPNQLHKRTLKGSFLMAVAVVRFRNAAAQMVAKKG